MHLLVNADKDTDLAAEWMAAMRSGDFARAWAIGDRVVAQHRGQEPPWHLPRHQQWLWDGRSLHRQRVLVHCYHGLGDTIQFARFLPLLTQAARTVTVWAQPPLVPLLATLPGIARVLPLHDGAPGVERDADVEIMELAHVFRVTADSVGRLVPYFSVPAQPRPRVGFLVGLLTQSGAWNARRSIPDALLAPLLQVPGVTFVNLHPQRPIPSVQDWSTPDVLTLMGRLRALDLVVTVDTMLAHAAGAMGAPTWTLLPEPADWRWMDGRRDSPWYPSMRLFRQPRPADWQTVLDEVRAALRTKLATAPG